MICRKARFLITEAVGENSREKTDRKLRAHLGGCPACRAEFQLSRMNLKILRAVTWLDPPRDYLSAVAAGAGAAKRRRRTSPP